MQGIPLVDLSVQHRQIADEVEAGFSEVLAAGDFIGGLFDTFARWAG